MNNKRKFDCINKDYKLKNIINNVSLTNKSENKKRNTNIHIYDYNDYIYKLNILHSKS